MDNPFAPSLLIEEHGLVRLVKINRPNALNAVDPAVHHGLAHVWGHLASDANARAIVITGEGRAFSAGGDMDMFKRLQSNPVERERLLEEARQLVYEVVNCPLPVVAAVNGAAVGLGCSLAVLCDIVFMGESAYFADPHVAVGLTAGDGGAPSWPLMMSILRAKEYLYTGDRIPADVAVSLGLANRVVPDEELLDTSMAFAQRLGSMPPQALRTTKRALNIHLTRAITGVLEYALAAEHQSFDSAEHRQVVAQFFDEL